MFTDVHTQMYIHSVSHESTTDSKFKIKSFDDQDEPEEEEEDDDAVGGCSEPAFNV